MLLAAFKSVQIRPLAKDGKDTREISPHKTFAYIISSLPKSICGRPLFAFAQSESRRQMGFWFEQFYQWRVTGSLLIEWTALSRVIVSTTDALVTAEHCEQQSGKSISEHKQVDILTGGIVLTNVGYWFFIIACISLWCSFWVVEAFWGYTELIFSQKEIETIDIPIYPGLQLDI